MLWPALAQLPRAAVQIIAPHRCVHCLAAGTWLCRPCFLQLVSRPRPALTCLLCETAAARGMTCRQCRHETVLTGALSGLSYGHPAVRRAVHWLKFQGVTEMAPLLAALLVRVLPLIAPLPVLRTEAVLVPIPLHRRRQRQRGYNQSLLLAEALSALTGVATLPALQRPRATAPQTRLPAELRGRNVAGAFVRVSEIPLAPRVILIDDVLTTGSTLLAAAPVVADAPGVREIWGLTAAR